ncbi:MAG: efflux RND transporter periplasmic adaptor subunit [Aquabacterium sp.]|nr:efflux RND transporter periplasmic adaptor subunit [Aquabacterium sp.]
MRLLLLPLVLLCLLTACSKPAPAPEPVRAVRTVTVQAGSANLLHEYPAEVRARAESRPAFRVGGKLVRRLVNVGDAVRAGQALAEIDPGDLRLGQDAARAQLAAAQAQLAFAEAEFKRYATLREQGFISGVELERRDAGLQSSRSQAAQAIAQARLQTNQAGYAMLTAEVAGIVTAVDAEPGTVLSAGAPVLRLAHDGPRDAVFSVPEDRASAMRAALGKPGAVQLKPWGGIATTPATVREVAAAADPVTRTFLVRADIGRTDLRLGQTATVLVATPPVPGVIKLPLTAVFAQGGQTSVWLVDRTAMTVRPQPITVAGADGNLVVVAGGLQPGQAVVTAGVHTLTPGQAVRWYVEPGAAAAPASSAAPAAPAASR